MAISTNLQFAKLEDLYLDPLNPRLGRNNAGREVPQERVLSLMMDWTLDELAISFLGGGGFWTHEALLAVEETLYGKKRLVVVEGNRRLAALILLKNAYGGNPASRKWSDIAESAKLPKDLFAKVPYLLVDSRKDVESFLGFRHVTGIKEWNPAEKAEFIAKLIDNRSMNYDEVAKKIGSKSSTIRQHYISYRLLLQIEDTLPNIPNDNIEERFSVMYLSLRTEGVRKYLSIDIQANVNKAKNPVPKKHLKALSNFALWLFGDEKRPALFSDSRKVDQFGIILESNEAIHYLERNESPSFEVAYNLAGGDEPEIVKLIEKSADNIELAFTRIHLYKKSKKVHGAIKRLGVDVNQLLNMFPEIKTEMDKESK